MDEKPAAVIPLLGGARDGLELRLPLERSADPETPLPTPTRQLVLPRLEPTPPVETLGGMLELLARWAAGEPCPFRLVLDLYNLGAEGGSGRLVYLFAGTRDWPLADWRAIPGVRWLVEPRRDPWEANDGQK